MQLAVVIAVRARAKGRCEYCRFPESEADLPFTIDHVIARQHNGPDTLDNLALACPFCNAHKGPNVAGVDPDSNGRAPLFDPRADRWYDHFRWDGVCVVGLTPAGRATVVALAMNDDYQIGSRLALVRSGWFFRADL